MKCNVCGGKLERETPEEAEALDGVTLWGCDECNERRELDPFDEPETPTEKEWHERLFGDKVYIRELVEETVDHPLEYATLSRRVHKVYEVDKETAIKKELKEEG